MGGSKKTEIQTTSGKQDPWAPAVPALGNIVAGSTAAYNSGVGSQVYGGQRYAGLGDTSQAALDTMAANANAGQGAAQAGNNFLTGLLGSGGSTSGIQTALASLDSIGKVDTSRVSSLADQMADPNNLAYSTARALTRGDYNLSTDGYNKLLTSLDGQTQSERSLQAAADGQYLGGANPYMDAVIGRSQGEAASKIAQQMGAAGRSGSGRYAATIADSLGAIGTQARYTDYDNERNRQVQAAGQIDQYRNARTGLQQGLYGSINNAEQANAGLALSGAGLYNNTNTTALGGATALAGLDNQNIQNALQTSGMKLSAAQADRAAAMQGLGMVGQNIQNLQAPGQTLAQVGAAQDADRQAQLDAAQQMFSEQQAAPWKQLGLYSQLVDPIAGLGQTTSGTSNKTANENPGVLNSIVGGVAGLTGSAANLGKAAPFLSMLGLSDERAKEEMREVGQTHDGQPIFSFRYKGDPETRLGFSAQEVAQRDPGSVAMRPDGLLAVDYDRATAPSALMAQVLRPQARAGARR